METQFKLFVTDHNHQPNPNPNPSSSLSSSNNLFKSQENNNIDADTNFLEFELFEMITLGDDNDCVYTSLKDISPPPELMMTKKDSWREVPIKDPLVQQAAWAWAYLPSMLPEDRRRSGFIGKLKDGFVECFKNVILAIVTKVSFEDEHEHEHEFIVQETDDEEITD